MSPTKFSLTIEIGNDMMEEGYDLASALMNVYEVVKDMGELKKASGSIFDINGNNCGTWKIK